MLLADVSDLQKDPGIKESRLFYPEYCVCLSCMAWKLFWCQLPGEEKEKPTGLRSARLSSCETTVRVSLGAGVLKAQGYWLTG